MMLIMHIYEPGKTEEKSARSQQMNFHNLKSFALDGKKMEKSTSPLAIT
jgi:hypothetical protein